MNNKGLVDTFDELVRIPSPSGHEESMAEYVQKKMAGLGWEVWNDDQGAKNDSDTGVVYAYLEKDKSLPTIVFSAHMDTVQKVGDVVNPVEKDGVIYSDGSTILGADNKAGVACLLDVAGEIKKEELKNNLLFFFPTREEAGVMGSSRFEFDKSKIKYSFNLDSSDTPGIFVYRSLGYINFKITVKGKSAHAAKAYESGVDAIGIACELRNKLKVGRNLEEGWTMNIGKMVGGSGTNVVCDEVIMYGEVRAFEKKVMDKVLDEIRKTCREARMEVEDESFIPPFEGDENGDLVKLCKEASNKCGLDFKVVSSFSTSDANFYSGKGYKTISVSRGGKNAHSTEENISIIDLLNARKLIVELIRLS